MARGLQPDAIMIGCLLCFSEERGGTELSQELSRLAPRQDVQNYVTLIRAAIRDKDANRAFDLLGKLERSGGR